LPLLFVAGAIEGYITPSTLSLETKYLVAAATLLLLCLWYVIGRRRQAHNASLAFISK
ncbi:stage II sporulation protein M, partial [Brevibacillus agri]